MPTCTPLGPSPRELAPCKVQVEGAVTNLERNAHLDIVVGDAVSLETIARSPARALHLPEPRTHTPLGIVEQSVACGAELRRAEARGQRLPAGGAARACGELRAEIAATLVWGADVREHEFEELLVNTSSSNDPDRRNDQSFLDELRRALRHAAGTHASHIGMMCANR